ncbi:MAG: hypothetical protein HYU86_06975 [Chloroflexi bacterium]|nr:hypothetical protein [Chloroflexota bacterium]
MNSFSGPSRWKINNKACWLFWFTAALITILLLPQLALAQERQTDLTLRLVSHWSYIEAIAGKDNIFFLEINNIGSKAITDIKLSSDKAEGWVIDFKPGNIDYLGPGSLQTVDVNIRPSWNVGRGKHGVNIIAEANEIRKVEKFWVTVKTASLWLWVGAGVVLVVIGAFVSIYMRFGRR